MTRQRILAVVCITWKLWGSSMTQCVPQLSNKRTHRPLTTPLLHELAGSCYTLKKKTYLKRVWVRYYQSAESSANISKRFTPFWDAGWNIWSWSWRQRKAKLMRMRFRMTLSETTHPMRRTQMLQILEERGHFKVSKPSWHPMQGTKRKHPQNECRAYEKCRVTTFEVFFPQTLQKILLMRTKMERRRTFF